MLRLVLVFFALEVLGSGAAAWLFKMGKLPARVRDLLCSHKLITPVIATLVAPFIALTSAVFWPALGAALGLSWLYLIFAVTTASSLMFKGSDGRVVYAVTVVWGGIASLVAAVSAILIHLSILMLR